MTVLLLILGFLALLTLVAVIPGVLWADAPDRRGEVRQLRSVPSESSDRLAA